MLNEEKSCRGSKPSRTGWRHDFNPAYSRFILILAFQVFFLVSACKPIAEEKAAMTTSYQTPPANVQIPLPRMFQSHPGSIAEHFKWNGSTKIEDAANVPDDVKFIYIDSKGNETADIEHAASRVPVVEIEIVSTDAHGKLSAPDQAVSFSTTYYGPGHRFLRHSMAVVAAR